MQRTLKIVTLTLVTVLLGTSVALVLQRSARMAYDASRYVNLQSSLHTLWGSQAIARFVEPAAIITALALAVFVRKQRGFFLVAAAAGALLLAFPVVFYARVSRAYAAFHDSALIGVMVPNWEFWRAEWETGQLMRFGLHVAAFVLLAAGVKANGSTKA